MLWISEVKCCDLVEPRSVCFLQVHPLICAWRLLYQHVCVSVSACQLGRKKLCNSSACWTRSCLQHIESLTLSKEPRQNSSQTQRDCKSSDDLVVPSLAECCRRQNKLQQSENKRWRRQTQKPHGKEGLTAIYNAHSPPNCTFINGMIWTLAAHQRQEPSSMVI